MLKQMLLAITLPVFAAGVLLIAVPTPASRGASYVVDTTADDPGVALTACTGVADDCSLRGAITDANASGPGDIITFDNSVFPSGAPATITVGTILPLISGGGDMIDGTGAGVIIDATGEAPSFTCLSVPSAGNTIKAVQFTDCTNGIALGNAASDGNTIGPGNVFFDNIRGVFIGIGGATQNQILGNKIGTNASGTAIHPDGGNSTGIEVWGSGNTVGGTTSGERNVIAGNVAGVGLNVSTTTGNFVIGNYVGTDVTGTVDIGNGSGVVLDGSASANTIGGLLPGEGNLISGNNTNNVYVLGFAAANRIIGNLIGPDVNASGAAMGNGVGVYVRSSASNNIIGPGNVISDNNPGVSIADSNTHGNVVKGNFIGTGPDGTSPVPNTTGVEMFNGANGNIVGGTGAGEGNVVAFNAGWGLSTNGATTIGNSFRANSTYSNGVAQIDNLNGGNTGLLPPTLSATLYGTVSGSACANCEVDVFSDNSTHARFYEGSAVAAADGSFTFVGGDLPFVGANVTATNTDGAGNTSELAASLVVDSDGDGTPDGSDSDDDNDGLTDNDEVAIYLTQPHKPDSDADSVIDGADNCKLWPNPSQALPNWSVPANDSDCDRITNTIETYLGTDPTRQCAADTTANNEGPPDRWPFDMNDNRIANTIDVGVYVFTLNESNPNHPGPNTNPDFVQRHDLNGNGIINTIDVGAYVFVLNKTCSPSGP